MQHDEKQKTVRCPICGAEFATQEEHDAHHKREHPGQ